MNNSTQDPDIFVKECTALFGRISLIVVKFPSNAHLMGLVMAAAVNSVLVIPTIVLNAVSISAIMKSDRLKSNPCYFLIVIQSLVDLSVGAVGIPLFILFIISPIIGFFDCSVNFLIVQTTFIPSGISIITLSAMTIERYIGVLHPYAYSTQVTRKRIVIYECCGGFLIIMMVGISLPVRFLLTHFSTVLIILFFLLNIFVYTRIYLVVIKIARMDKIQTENVAEQNATKKQQFLSEVKHAKSCFLVLICFIICLLPQVLANSFKLNTFDRFVYQTWSITLIMLNSSANSVIFFWTKKSLRVQAIQILRSRR